MSLVSTAVTLLAILVAGLLAITLRLLQVIRQTHAGARRPARHRDASNQCRLVVFLGSGGHTGEMLRLLCALDFDRYSHRTYVVSSGDSLSLAKVAELEQAKSVGRPPKQSWSIAEIPRARRVHQSFLTAPFTTLQSLVACLRLFTLPSLLSKNGTADLILLNGPGSCVPIVVSAFLPRLLNLHSPQMVYIESMARVRRLSLSGKIVRLFVDRFFVEWQALADGKRTGWLAMKEYRGILV